MRIRDLTADQFEAMYTLLRDWHSVIVRSIFNLARFKDRYPPNGGDRGQLKHYEAVESWLRGKLEQMRQSWEGKNVRTNPRSADNKGSSRGRGGKKRKRVCGGVEKAKRQIP